MDEIGKEFVRRYEPLSNRTKDWLRSVSFSTSPFSRQSENTSKFQTWKTMRAFGDVEALLTTVGRSSALMQE